MRKITLKDPMGFPLKEKTLKDILTEGTEIKPVNGHVHFTKFQKMIVGSVSDFKVDTSDLPQGQDHTIVFTGEPNTDSRFFVKKVNAYNLRVEVKDPD